MFGIFNAITIVMVLAQCWVWKDKVKEIMLNVTAHKSNDLAWIYNCDFIRNSD